MPVKSRVKATRRAHDATRLRSISWFGLVAPETRITQFSREHSSYECDTRNAIRRGHQLSTRGTRELISEGARLKLLDQRGREAKNSAYNTISASEEYSTTKRPCSCQS